MATQTRKYHITTFGCQMNDHDSLMLKSLLSDAGHVEADSEDDADILLFNTCAVRAKAEQKVYSMLGTYKNAKKERPDLIIGVGGCMAQGEGRRVFSRAPFVDLVFGTKTIHRVPDMVARVITDRKRLAWTEMKDDGDALSELYSHSRGQGLKSFVTVMQGCDNYCSYCIVPYVRGHEFSRKSTDIVDEVTRLAGGGVREVTLLGQNVNSYGLKGGDGVDFPGLIRMVAGVEGLSRIRFTTSHPKDLSDELIGLFASEPKLMPHLHLPVQSGSDRILKEMNRRYDTAHYLGLIEKVRAAAPGIALTSDMIVGFPGETDEDFEATLEIMRRVRFDNLFSFKYSPREGTKAAEMPGQIDEALMIERLAVLQALQKEHTLEHNRAYIGQTRSVLVDGESRTGGQLMGRTPENKIVNFEGDASLMGREVDMEITEAYVNSLLGRIAV